MTETLDCLFMSSRPPIFTSNGPFIVTLDNGFKVRLPVLETTMP
ncbi:hypothetical protein [Xylanibacter brevis]|nr:hypothetical protein [Xylanibacter brevis]